jgi:hypothetical protein
MTLTVLGILIFVVIVLIGALISVTVTFSKSLQRVADHADRVHDRSTAQLTEVLDRLMAKNFEEFKSYEPLPVHGEFLIPDQQERPWDVPGVFRPGAGLAGGAVEVGVSPEEDDDENR